MQTPGLPGRLHASHWPVHAALQQYPSAQMPLVHWLGPLQGPPFAFRGTHACPLQKLVPAQSASLAHDLRQSLTPQA